MKKTFVCHPFGGYPEGNVPWVGRICAQVAPEGVLPVAPQIYLFPFIDEETQQDLTLKFCLQVLKLCDQFLAILKPITPGRGEIDRAWRLGFPVRFRK